LAPATDDLYFKELHDQKLKEVSAIVDPEQRAIQAKFTEQFFQPKNAADTEWYWWHQILGKYFATSQVWAAPWQYFLSMLHTASWAVILMMILNHHNNWFAWILCGIGVFFGNFSSWFSDVNKDPYAINQTAMLLRALKPLRDTETAVRKDLETGLTG
jgi:hypothetical protein